MRHLVRAGPGESVPRSHGHRDRSATDSPSWIVVPERHVVSLGVSRWTSRPRSNRSRAVLHAGGDARPGPGDSPSWSVPGRSGSSGCGRCRRPARAWHDRAAVRGSATPRGRARRRRGARTRRRRRSRARIASAGGARDRPQRRGAVLGPRVRRRRGRVHAFASVPGGAPIDEPLVHYRHLRLVGSAFHPRRLPAGSRHAAPGSIIERLPSRAVALEEVRRSSTPAPTPGAAVRGETVGCGAGGGSVADRREGPIRVALIGYSLAGAVFHGPLVSSTPGWRSRRS